ncbi:polyketide synthase dehydratase domain-containing protein, partial [Streptomyces sp. NPDC056161]|uniref:polyketide synthase dehydratase domain-containing protein n=1 Tax=Streptomyces sp. NPDC056161 TaxID=3345732 RepID=UPI0035D58904
MGGGYWYRNLRQPVRFGSAVQALVADGFRVFVESSAHGVLTGAVSDVVSDVVGDVPSVVTGSLRRGDGGMRRFLSSAANLWVRGVDVDWSGVLPGVGGSVPSLPTYAFQRQRYWLGVGRRVADVGGAGLGVVGHPLLGAVVELPDADGSVFTGRVSLKSHPWLDDHRVSGSPLVPGTALLELVVRAGEEVGYPVVGELVIESPLLLPEQAELQIQVTVGAPDETGRRPVSVYSRRADSADGTSWSRHVSGLLATASERATADFAAGQWPPVGAEPVELSGFYEELAGRGYEYGPAFQGLKAVWKRGDEVFAEVALPEDLRSEATEYVLHPALLDAALQATNLGAAPQAEDGQVLLPFAWNDVTVHAAGAGELRIRATASAPDAVSLSIADGVGVVVAEVGSLVLRPIGVGELSSVGVGV